MKYLRAMIREAPTQWVVPPVFDPDYYARTQPDLAAYYTGYFADAARWHWETHGRDEGRIASPLAVREGMSAFLDRPSARILEIGPFFNPFVTGPGVSYLDVLDADQLRSRALEIGADLSRLPAKIDYVGGLDKVDRTFDAVISCHSVEHQYDLVRHLQGVASVLKPGGIYALVVPDKRFCFDHFLPESTIADVVQAYEDRRSTHPLKSVIEHCALTTHNDPGRHWAGDHGTLSEGDRTNRVRIALDMHAAAKGGYIDVHAWYFTPANFREIMGTLHSLGLSPLEVAGVYDTPHNRFEFCAVLRAA